MGIELSGVEQIDGTLFLRVATLTAERVGWRTGRDGLGALVDADRGGEGGAKSTDEILENRIADFPWDRKGFSDV